MNKLYRSRRDRKLTGLCGGLAEQLNVDSNILRMVVVVTAFFSGGTVIPIYAIASIVISKEPVLNVPPVYPPPGGMSYGMNGGTYGQGAYGAGSYGSGAYGTQPQTGAYRPQSGYAGVRTAEPAPKPAGPNIDEMMKDVEKKALRKEIEELRAKVAQYEKGE